MLYLVKVPDFIHYLESRLGEISEKTDIIDAVAGRVEGLPIQELLARVDTLEANVGRLGNYEYGDSSSGFVAHMEGRVNEVDNAKKTLLEMINDMSEDFRATFDVIRNEIADVKTRMSLTMRAMANQIPVGGAVPVTKVKVPEPKPFCGVRDAKALENFMFDLEQYFKATNTVTEEAKVTVLTRFLKKFDPWSLGRNLVSSKEFQSSKVFLKLETWKKACIFKGASIFEGVLEVEDLEEILYLQRNFNLRRCFWSLGRKLYLQRSFRVEESSISWENSQRSFRVEESSISCENSL
ncbi:senescence-specific cysteine protease sag39 [Cucumis melo var. makuwa]|uniref:Senescence-specific cysteine protease sag39 n=1 Tax=Cucumis melo var. makuwa TaxID=1194695 RepID=A0A5A7VHM4_CUCMM|nr:senescence-specific cysteine protease sag39 [Cucumis melo var. makuwa]